MEDLQKLIELFIEKGENRVKLGPKNNKRLSELIVAIGGEDKFKEMVESFKNRDTQTQDLVDVIDNVVAQEELAKQSPDVQPEAFLEPLQGTPKLEFEVKPVELLQDAWGEIKDADDRGRLHGLITNLRTNPDNSFESVLKQAMVAVVDGNSRGAIKRRFRLFLQN